MAAFKVDGTFTAAEVQGGPNRTFPFERDTTAFIEEQKYIIAKANFSRLAIGTVHPTITTAFLVAETDLQNVGAGLVEWTRRYATVPATRNEYETYLHTFLEIVNATGGDGARSSFTKKVNSRIEYAYFHVGSVAYPTIDDVPLISGFQPTYAYWGSALEVEFLSLVTTPTSDAYLAMVAAEDEIAVEDSDVRPWMGNIYERVTRYVVAR